MGLCLRFLARAMRFPLTACLTASGKVHLAGLAEITTMACSMAPAYATQVKNATDFDQENGYLSLILELRNLHRHVTRRASLCLTVTRFCHSIHSCTISASRTHKLKPGRNAGCYSVGRCRLSCGA